MNLEDRVVTHHVGASKLPNWEGSEQVRLFQVSGDQLKIETRPMQFRGTEWVIHVLFQRPVGFAAASSGG